MQTIDRAGVTTSGAGRRLLLMRHAKSDWSGAAERDFDRPINARGTRDAPRMGRWLREQGLLPAAVLCSPALRAQQTLASMRAELPIPEAHIRFLDDLYLAEPTRLLTILAAVEVPPATLLLLGHNPGLAQLLAHLVGFAGLPPGDNVMPTAAVAVCQVPDDWLTLAPGCARLEHWMTPKRLPD